MKRHLLFFALALGAASCAKCSDSTDARPVVTDAAVGADAAKARDAGIRDGGRDASKVEADDDDEPHADAGAPVVPRTEVHTDDDLDEPEFKGHGFPALSEDKKTLAYFFVDGDLGPTAGHSVVFVDTAKGKVETTFTLVRAGELLSYVERGKAYGKEPWQGRVDAANAALGKHKWTAVAYAPGIDWNDDTDEGYQGPSPVDGLLIGIADRKKPTTLVVKDIASSKVLLERDVKSWQKNTRGSLGFFDYAASRELSICVMKSRVVDEPYALRIVTFGPDAGN
ncbi:MAG: hypothetical protein HOO96_35135 [Polyangiaceae bacterium]|nr:hypothetical protein [Polyangiaceae bacterium]